MKKQKFYVVTVIRNKIGIDKYYREDEASALSLLKANEDLFPKAKFEFGEEEIIVEDKKN